MRSMVRSVGVVLLATVAAAANADGAKTATETRMRLTSSQLEPRQSSERYTVRARFAAEEKAGELREGGSFVLIGRIAKRGVVCPSGDTIFGDGFEGP